MEPGGPQGARRPASRRATGRGAHPQRLPAPVARGSRRLRRRRRARRRHAAQLHPGLPTRHAPTGRPAVHRVRGLRTTACRPARLLPEFAPCDGAARGQPVGQPAAVVVRRGAVLLHLRGAARRPGAVRHAGRAAGGEAQLRAGPGRLPDGRRRASALSRPARGGQGRAAAHGRVGRDRGGRRCGRAARDRRRGAAGARGDRLGGGPGRRAVRRPVRPGAVPSGRRAVGRRGGSLDVAGGVRPGGCRGDGGRSPDRRRRSRRLRRTRRGRGHRAAAPAGRARLARVLHTPDRGRAGPQPGDGPGGPAPLRAGFQPGRRPGAPGGGVPHRDRGSVRRRRQRAADRDGINGGSK